MSASYLEIRAADRVELDDLAREIFVSAVREELLDDVDEVLEKIGDGEWVMSGEVLEKIRDAITNGVAGRGVFSRVPPNGVARFVDELGRRGWEILAPSVVLIVHRKLRFVNIMKETVLSRRRSSGRTTVPTAGREED